MNISAIAYSVSSFLANVTCCITIPSLKKVFVSCIFVTIVATIIKVYNYDLQYLIDFAICKAQICVLII